MRAAKSKARSRFLFIPIRIATMLGLFALSFFGGPMRIVLFILLTALVTALPLWPFNNHWSYGPAIAVAFLLTVNLIVVACDFRSRGGRDNF
jgi:hypothetical protein